MRNVDILTGERFCEASLVDESCSTEITNLQQICFRDLLFDRCLPSINNIRTMCPPYDLTGIDRLMSDQKPVTRSSADDPEEDEGLGDGDPPEMKEFIEELEGTGQEFMAKPSPSLLGLPLVLLFGCLTVSTAIWKDCTSFLDLMLMRSPLGDSCFPAAGDRASCLCDARVVCLGDSKECAVPFFAAGVMCAAMLRS